MQANLIPDAPKEIHYTPPKSFLECKVPPATAKIIQIDPECILGGTKLFIYDSTTQAIALSRPFQELLKLLVKIQELDPAALKASSLAELNKVLQQPQGPSGGLLRKEGVERWDLKDNAAKQAHRSEIDLYLIRLGFVSPQSITSPLFVDHCLIFGARAERMEKRILETLRYLQNNINVTGHIFLLGSKRKLVPDELKFLQTKLEKLDESRKSYWSQAFSNTENPHAIEANAFLFLWETLVPPDLQTHFKDKLIPIQSTRIGSSYRDTEGYRTTTEVTAEDWMAYYKEGKAQAIFALAEQPYVRLKDQLRVTVVTKGKKATRDELIERIKLTTFNFASPAPDSPPNTSVQLDEVARNVYRLVDTLNYLEKSEGVKGEG